MKIIQRCFHSSAFFLGIFSRFTIHFFLQFYIEGTVYFTEFIFNTHILYTYAIHIAVKVLEFKKMFSRVDLFFVFLNDMKLWCVKNQLPRRFDGRNLSIISVKTLANGPFNTEIFRQIYNCKGFSYIVYCTAVVKNIGDFAISVDGKCSVLEILTEWNFCYYYGGLIRG